MIVGLTLGKFAPLHRGHQWLIETALSQCDHLLILIYDSPEVTDTPLPVRAAWIRELYPQAEVLECYEGPSEVGDSPELQRAHEEYILRRIAGRRIHRFFSSEFYGAHVSKALGADDVRVDPERTRVPVSGTAVRKDTYALRHYLHPRVYRDLVRNVVFLGAPSSGKTTLCQALARALGTTWMPEYGREYWELHQHNRRLTINQLVEIAEGHLHREDQRLLQANRVLLTDTNALTTWQFCLEYHGCVPKRLEELADQCWVRYDQVYVCDIDIPYDDTWDRSGDAHRETFQQNLLQELDRRQVRYHLVKGTLDERMRQVAGSLLNHGSLI